MPGIGSIVNGDISAKRKMTAEYIKGFYKSTFFPDARNGPFAADAIISNPPAFAHIHVAQCLGIPLHMSFSESFVGLGRPACRLQLCPGRQPRHSITRSSTSSSPTPRKG